MHVEVLGGMGSVFWCSVVWVLGGVLRAWRRGSQGVPARNRTHFQLFPPRPSAEEGSNKSDERLDSLIFQHPGEGKKKKGKKYIYTRERGGGRQGVN